jgi:3-phytase
MSWTGSQDVRLLAALVLALAVFPAQAWGAAVASVRARVETRPVPHAGDAADDVAIWVNRRWPGRSGIIGMDKKGGIAVYDLDGHLVQFRADGELNNVDLRRNFPSALGG